jgi:hypothetical protein
MVKMDNNFTDYSFFYSEIPRNFELYSLTHSKVIPLLIFTKFTRELMEVRHLIDKERVKYGAMSFKIFTFIISAFRNNVAKLHLHSLHGSGEINNNVLKL